MEAELAGRPMNREVLGSKKSSNDSLRECSSLMAIPMPCGLAILLRLVDAVSAGMETDLFKGGGRSSVRPGDGDGESGLTGRKPSAVCNSMPESLEESLGSS